MQTSIFITHSVLNNTIHEFDHQDQVRSASDLNFCQIESSGSQSTDGLDDHSLCSPEVLLSVMSKKISKKEKPADGQKQRPLRKLRTSWKEDEDKLLLQLVQIYGHNWAMIASKMQGRTGKQIRERYLHSLRPGINKDEWTAEEDQILREQYKKYGSKWSHISKCIPGRTENQVKNRFHSYIKKTLEESPNDLVTNQIKTETSSLQSDSPKKTNSLTSPLIREGQTGSGYDSNMAPSCRQIPDILNGTSIQDIVRRCQEINRPTLLDPLQIKLQKLLSLDQRLKEIELLKQMTLTQIAQLKQELFSFAY